MWFSFSLFSLLQLDRVYDSKCRAVLERKQSTAVSVRKLNTGSGRWTDVGHQSFNGSFFSSFSLLKRAEKKQKQWKSNERKIPKIISRSFSSSCFIEYGIITHTHTHTRVVGREMRSAKKSFRLIKAKLVFFFAFLSFDLFCIFVKIEIYFEGIADNSGVSFYLRP